MIALWLVLGALAFLGICVVLLAPSRRSSAASNAAASTVQVVVLGDIGRSPRMQYHAISLAKLGYTVDIIGYKESDLHAFLESSSTVNVVGIPPWPKRYQTDNKLLFLGMAPLKVLWQTWGLFSALAYRTAPAKFTLVQNPPSIPTLLVAHIVCLLRNTTLCIDWHNFGHSILALKLGAKHPLVQISERYEYAVSRSAPVNFTVTDAMARILREQHGRKYVVPLYDRPPAHFQPCPSDEARKEGYQELAKRLGWPVDGGPTRLLVSSTSWTADEDFSILLDALAGYSAVATAQDLPMILAVITGKGPQKEYYLSRIAAMERENKLDRVRIRTAWLTMEDYAAMLSFADLGVSLHMSSSGVDLPMKVVDMFGAGLPVVGWSQFEAWSELVKEGINGKGFGSSTELRELLLDLFTKDDELARLRAGALKECDRRWDDEWEAKAGKIFA
ncbi:beta-mannosyltransferase [Diplodia corticola]|uniref:Chitobiosyldiphosphodolichol beta-mannosyltransferase n=1 Tax=Diplodia corticola TaxID=236234 RepID=A0A1J9SBB8_9PEZI|nr:beta-mannosyltransferase [Diplodia corticola]OJD37148.1 beta-mannosyltransferase [Diplodia corticola]